MTELVYGRHLEEITGHVGAGIDVAVATGMTAHNCYRILMNTHDKSLVGSTRFFFNTPQEPRKIPTDPAFATAIDKIRKETPFVFDSAVGFFYLREQVRDDPYSRENTPRDLTETEQRTLDAFLGEAGFRRYL
ncbi:hypothetical protein HY485_01415 [Candidatus Woesearchaeota archaeon]|nr:hypothetical protein [Candidatus Woesearchaeota archaeon]